jgi:predicted dehydrogenase
MSSPAGASVAHSAPIRCGVVGLNSRAERVILPGLAASSRAALVAVCSRDRAKAERVAGVFGASAFTDLTEMARTVDAVLICTPSDVHREMVEVVVGAGKSVMCEKPLATTLADALAMTRAADRAGVRTAVNFTYRTTQGHRLVEHILRTHDLGTLLHFELAYLQSKELQPDGVRRDSLLELGSHLIDLVRWWGGAVGAGDITSVIAATGPNGQARAVWDPNASTRPVYQVLLDLENGASGFLVASRVASGHGNAVHARLHCTRGAVSLAFDTAESVVRVQHANGTWQDVVAPPEFVVSYTDFPAVHFHRVVGALRGEEEFPTFADGLAVQAVIDAIDRSAIDGSRRDVPSPGALRGRA